MPNCKPERSKPCGRACIPLTKICRKTTVVPGTTSNCVPKIRKPRKEPTCTEGRSYKCGKACVAVTRPCKKSNTPAPVTPLPPEGANDRLAAMWRGLEPSNVRVRTRQGDWVPEDLGDRDTPVPDTPISGGCTPCRRTITRTGSNSFII